MWACDAPGTDDFVLGVRVLDGLCLELNIQPSHGIQSWAEPALRRVEELAPALRAVVLAASGVHAWLTGDLAVGASLGDRALAEWAATPRVLAQALVPAVFCKAANGQTEQALACMFEVMTRLAADEPGDYLLSGLHTSASTLAFHSGDHERARSEADAALAAARRAGCPSALAMALATYGRSGATSPEDALAAAEEALRLIEAGAGDTVKTSALQTTATAHLEMGHIAEAARDALRALEHDVKNGNRVFVANDLWVAARIFTPHSVILRSEQAGRLLEGVEADQDGDERRRVKHGGECLEPGSAHAEDGTAPNLPGGGYGPASRCRQNM